MLGFVFEGPLPVVGLNTHTIKEQSAPTAYFAFRVIIELSATSSIPTQSSETVRNMWHISASGFTIIIGSQVGSGSFATGSCGDRQSENGND